jgi:hypothetical protein
MRKRVPIAPDGAAAAVRKPSKPPLIEPFYVAVDRQLKSGHQTYEAAEKAALAIKKLHPQLHVTVYDRKHQRHATVEQPSPAGASNRNRLGVRAARNTLERRRAANAGSRR